MVDFANDIMNYTSNVITAGNPNFLKWFARVLVQKRAALEQNHMQANYVQLLSKVNRRPLYKRVTKETYIFLKYLLTNKHEKANEKNLMKNLGM